MTKTKGPRPAQPRIAPVDPSDMTEAQRSAPGIDSAVVRTLVRRADLLAPWGAFGGVMLSGGRLSIRDRELVILRVALRTECEYEWANHVPAAIAAGVSREEIATFAETDSPLLRAVDELCVDNCITEDTWNALSAGLDDDTIIELLIVAGYYLMNAGMLNSLGVQKEPGRVGLGEVPAPRVSSIEKPTGPAHGSPSGTWEVTFHHPVDDQQLILEFACTEGKLTGTVTNEAAGVTMPIHSGTVEGSEIHGRTEMTQPLTLELDWAGAVYGEVIFGDVTISGGVFPFEGVRS